MPGINPEQEQARIDYYLSRRKIGSYLNRALSFYPGAPTIPTNFIANKTTYINNGLGPGAKILNGIEPFVPEPLPCDEPVIESLVVGVFGDLHVTVLYNVEPGDIYVMFNTSDGTFLPIISVTPIVGGVNVIFNDDSPPATPGAYTFKILRADNAECFVIRASIFTVAPVVCEIEIDSWTGDGIPPPPFTFVPPGTPGLTATVIGSGFLPGPLTVVLENAFPPFNNLDITLVTVIDDNTLTINWNATDGGPVSPAPDGNYGVRISLTDDPTCFDEFGFEFFEPSITISAF